MGVLAGITAPEKYRTSCQVRSVRERLDNEDKTIFDGWLNNNEVWSSASIAETMTKQGFQIGRTAVQKHRREACSCFRI